MYCSSLKSTEELSFLKLKRNTKFEEESNCRFKIDIRNLTNFDRSTRKSQKFHFNGLLLSRVYIVWTKKVERSYLSWHWRVIQNLQKDWLVAWKMTRRIWQIYTRALESVRIGTLMGFFEEELTCGFKIDMCNFTNFDLSTQKSKKFVF